MVGRVRDLLQRQPVSGDDAHAGVAHRGSEHLEGDGFRADPDFKNVAVSKPRGVAGVSLLLPGQ